jgi:diguanylate cyclase (GGDEF)-like protein
LEFRSLFQIVVSRWWLVLPIFLVTFGVAVVFTLSQSAVYEATARLVVTPSVDVQDDALSAFALISRQSELTDTYAQIASSRTIQRTAADELGLSGEQRRGLRLASRLIPGTTLLEVTATTTDRSLASEYANAVSEALVAYVDANYGLFKVGVLDSAGIPDRPVSPNVPVNIALGAAAGLLLGVGLAVVAQLMNPPARAGLRDVVDPETWAFNDSFFAYRLSQEVSRSRRAHRPTSLALIDINHEGSLDELLPRTRTEALRRIASLLDSHLRPEDVIARLYGTLFGVILPDTSEQQAVAMVESLRGRITAPALGTLGDGAPAHANPAAGVVEYGEGTGDIMQQAQSALRAAKEGPIGRTEAFSSLSVQPGT